MDIAFLFPYALGMFIRCVANFLKIMGMDMYFMLPLSLLLNIPTHIMSDVR